MPPPCLLLMAPSFPPLRGRTGPGRCLMGPRLGAAPGPRGCPEQCHINAHVFSILFEGNALSASAGISASLAFSSFSKKCASSKQMALWVLFQSLSHPAPEEKFSSLIFCFFLSLTPSVHALSESEIRRCPCGLPQPEQTLLVTVMLIP